MARSHPEDDSRISAAPGIPVAVRISDRARRLRITVTPERGPELVAPRGTSPAAMSAMVARNREWILRNARRMEDVASRRALGLDRPGVAWLGGEPIPVEPVGGERSRATLRGGALAVSGPDPVAAMARFYRREARRRLEASTTAEAARLGVTPGRLSVRDPRTRWGSCSPRGDLSFSWRLVLLPPEILRYVVVHELCHIRELNHSKRFWALLDRHLPGWSAQASWLREHSYEIGAYTPRPHPRPDGDTA